MVLRSRYCRARAPACVAYSRALLRPVFPACDTAGVIGPIVSVIAGIQVAEALKILSGRHDRISRRITTIHLWENRHEVVDLPPPVSRVSVLRKTRVSLS